MESSLGLELLESECGGMRSFMPSSTTGTSWPFGQAFHWTVLPRSVIGCKYGDGGNAKLMRASKQYVYMSALGQEMPL